MKVFAFEDYRDFLKEFFATLPKGGYGKSAKMAQACEMNPATLTLVLKKERDFTLDQAADVCTFLGLSDLETDYFFTSVQLQRAAKPNLRSRLKVKLKELKVKSEIVKNRLGNSKEFDDQAKAQFYSQWYFSAARLACSIPSLQNVEAIAEHLNLPRKNTQLVIDFLLKYQLIEEKKGQLMASVQSTHLAEDSFLVSRHHTNWRLQAIEKMKLSNKEDLFFTSPVSISKSDIKLVREALIKSLEDIFKIVDPSKEEELACINIDWFKI